MNLLNNFSALFSTDIESIFVTLCACTCLYLLVRMAFFSSESDVSQYKLKSNAKEKENKQQPLKNEDAHTERVAPNVVARKQHMETKSVSKEKVSAKPQAQEVKQETPDYTEQEDHAKENTEDKPTQPIVLFIKSKNEEKIHGYKLWKALADNDVHLSEEKHFQRFADKSGKGEVWFYVCSLAQPGTFDVSDPGRISCPGLALILNTGKISQIMHAFDSFVESAYHLAKDLDANVLDSDMKAVNRVQINTWRQEITKHAAALL